jgi:hypothetical protein
MGEARGKFKGSRFEFQVEGTLALLQQALGGLKPFSIRTFEI